MGRALRPWLMQRWGVHAKPGVSGPCERPGSHVKERCLRGPCTGCQVWEDATCRRGFSCNINGCGPTSHIVRSALQEGIGTNAQLLPPSVLAAQVTSYLMMGALSPGLKRHSVTLFEGAQTPSH